MKSGGAERILLALDTSGAVGSVAVGRDGSVEGRATLSEPRAHAARLVPAIQEVLAQASVGVVDLTGIVVGEGPGSFTGVRVAAATAKGLTHALRIPLWAVSSLEAAALTISGSAPRYVLFDARGDRVYGACYSVDQSAMHETVAPHGGTLGEVLSEDLPAGTVFLGDGAERHRLTIEAAGLQVVAAPPDDVALGLLRYMELNADTDPVAEPSAWEPAYIRASSAERSWSA